MPVYLANCTHKTNMKETIRGTEIEYQLSGKGDNRVLLLHGWGCDMSLMQPVCNALVSAHSVLMLDFPGHGKSGRPPEPWGVPEYAECLLELLTKLRFIPCSVIAHSFGCRVAAWLAANRPEIFSRMIFTGAAGIRPVQSDEAKKRSERYRHLKSYTEKIRKIPGFQRAGVLLEEKLRLKYGSRDYNALDDEMRKTFVKVISLDLSDLYSRIRQSTLLIWGDADTETPLWMGEEMKKRIPDAGLVILEGGSHFAYLEQLSRFNTIAAHFLKEEP